MGYLEEHGANEWLLLGDGCAAEDVARAQWKWHVFDHVGQELEVLHVTHEVSRTVQVGQGHKDVLQQRIHIYF